MCAMCGCNSPEFMGVTLNAPAAQNAGTAGELNPGQTFATDSMNTLGVEGADYRGANKRTDLNA
jgi:hypothetical protein